MNFKLWSRQWEIPHNLFNESLQFTGNKDIEFVNMNERVRPERTWHSGKKNQRYSNRLKKNQFLLERLRKV